RSVRLRLRPSRLWRFRTRTSPVRRGRAPPGGRARIARPSVPYGICAYRQFLPRAAPVSLAITNFNLASSSYYARVPYREVENNSIRRISTKINQRLRVPTSSNLQQGWLSGYGGYDSIRLSRLDARQSSSW